MKPEEEVIEMKRQQFSSTPNPVKEIWTVPQYIQIHSLGRELLLEQMECYTQFILQSNLISSAKKTTIQYKIGSEIVHIRCHLARHTQVSKKVLG